MKTNFTKISFALFVIFLITTNQSVFSQCAPHWDLTQIIGYTSNQSDFPSMAMDNAGNILLADGFTGTYFAPPANRD